MAPSDNLRSSRRRTERPVSDDEYEESLADDSCSDSDSEFEPSIFAGLTMRQLQGKSEKPGRAKWPEEWKTAVFKMAILRGFSAKNLPTPEVFLDVCTHIDLPLDCGKTVASSSIKKLVTWIENNVPPKAASELIAYKLVPKYNKAAYEIHVSAALFSAVQREDFSFARDILGGVVRREHSELGYNNYQVLNPSTIGSAALQKQTFKLLMERGLITKQSKGKLGTVTTSKIAGSLGNRLNAAPGFQQAIPGLVTTSPYSSYYLGQAHASGTPAPGLTNTFSGHSYAIPQSVSYGSAPGYSIAGPAGQSAPYGSGTDPSQAYSASPAQMPTTGHSYGHSYGHYTAVNGPSYATSRSNRPNETDGRAPTTPAATSFPSIFASPPGYGAAAKTKTPKANVAAHATAYPSPPPSGSRGDTYNPCPPTPTPAPKFASPEQEVLWLRQLVADLQSTHLTPTHPGPSQHRSEIKPEPSCTPGPSCVNGGVPDNTHEGQSDAPHYLQQGSQPIDAGSVPLVRSSSHAVATTLSACPAVPVQDPAGFTYAGPSTAPAAIEPPYLANNRPPTAFGILAQPVPARQHPGTSSSSHMPGQWASYAGPPAAQQVPPAGQAPVPHIGNAYN